MCRSISSFTINPRVANTNNTPGIEGVVPHFQRSRAFRDMSLDMIRGPFRLNGTTKGILIREPRRNIQALHS